MEKPSTAHSEQLGVQQLAAPRSTPQAPDDEVKLLLEETIEIDLTEGDFIDIDEVLPKFQTKAQNKEPLERKPKKTPGQLTLD